MNSIHALLEVALTSRASDLILKTDARPALRVDGAMHLLDLPALSSAQTRELCQEIIFCAARDLLLRSSGDTKSLDISDSRLQELKEHKEIDLVFTIPNQARVRASLYLELGEFGAALRIIPLNPYSIEQLDLPLTLKKLALEPHGLILITGPIGSGKTTTMAAMIEEINRHRSSNIFTLEDPVEYIIPDKQSLVHQREIGVDSENFASALKSVLRQCPDVIAIGELRDRETIEAALSAAETGHLVLSTMHTTSAVITIDRLINSVPIYLFIYVLDRVSIL